METKANLLFCNPKSDSEYFTRDQMLTHSLREGNLPWNYSNEYPIVLHPNASDYSWCAYDQGILTAHANLWPRTLTHISTQKTIQLGLVGNVATHPDHRGKGHMAALMTHLEKIAEQQNLAALVLWSDLLEFYQNLGFRSIGRELRMSFQRSDKPKQTGIARVSLNQLSDNDLETMLVLRPKLEWSLNRSLLEFKKLLEIPDSHLFVRKRGVRIQSWCIIGKGMDMKGVIHEWGATSADELAADVQSILNEYELPELILLCPNALHHHWVAPLKMRAAQTTEHAMALAKNIRGQESDIFTALGKGFIWGLDSI